MITYMRVPSNRGWVWQTFIGAPIDFWDNVLPNECLWIVPGTLRFDS